MRKTNVRQHTRTVKGRQCNVVRHQRSLKPNFGRVGNVIRMRDGRKLTHDEFLKGYHEAIKKKGGFKLPNVIAPDLTTTKYFKNESWEAVDFKDGFYTLVDGKGNTEYATPEEVGERSVKFPTKQIKALDDAKFLDVMDGGEVWTDAFGDRFDERVCVGFEKGKIIHGGKRFTPTAKELKELKHDVAIAEWGTSNPEKIRKMEGF